jgi:acyl-CoA synthetase (AMP-forming)/AMP-acid ligase II
MAPPGAAAADAAAPPPLEVVPVLDGLRAWAAAWPDDTLYIWLRADAEVARLTFGQLWGRAGAVAAALTSRWGARRGDTALLVFPPGLELAVALFGCFRAGVIAVPVRLLHCGKSDVARAHANAKRIAMRVIVHPALTRRRGAGLPS